MDDAVATINNEETAEEEAAEEDQTDEQMAELGYRKVQIMNQNGTDIFDSTEETAAVIGHADTGSELWIKNAEAEGWAEIYTEEETKQFIKLADIEKQPPTDEEMLALGYVKVYVAMNIGANIYAGQGEKEEPIGHLDAGTELWVQLTDGANRAAIINPDDFSVTGYISLVDIIATKKPEGMDKLPTREIAIHSPLDETEVVVLFIGTKITLTTELINFNEDDHYTVRWQYSKNGKKFIDIPDANELEYTYITDKDNGNYIWKAIVELVAAEDK